MMVVVVIMVVIMIMIVIVPPIPIGLPVSLIPPPEIPMIAMRVVFPLVVVNDLAAIPYVPIVIVRVVVISGVNRTTR